MKSTPPPPKIKRKEKRELQHVLFTHFWVTETGFFLWPSLNPKFLSPHNINWLLPCYHNASCLSWCVSYAICCLTLLMLLLTPHLSNMWPIKDQPIWTHLSVVSLTHQCSPVTIYGIKSVQSAPLGLTFLLNGVVSWLMCGLVVSVLQWVVFSHDTPCTRTSSNAHPHTW